MAADNRDALQAATRHRAADTRDRARQALRQLDRDGTAITFTAVAAAAGVSRSLLYSDPELRAEIDQLRDRIPTGPTRPPAAERASVPSLQQRLATALDDNRTLRHENQLLRQRLSEVLGHQRAAITPNP